MRFSGHWLRVWVTNAAIPGFLSARGGYIFSNVTSTPVYTDVIEWV